MNRREVSLSIRLAEPSGDRWRISLVKDAITKKPDPALKGVKGAHMRRKCKTPYMRIRRAFLLFPKCLDGEWRWLEWATWEELPSTDYLGCRWWLATHWLDSDKELGAYTID